MAALTRAPRSRPRAHAGSRRRDAPLPPALESDADFSPDGTKLAAVRWVNGRNQLEYPIGKVLYETAGYISHPRISPKGDRVAFMDHQVQWDNRGWVVVVDLNSKKTVLTSEWSG